MAEKHTAAMSKQQSAVRKNEEDLAAVYQKIKG